MKNRALQHKVIMNNFRNVEDPGREANNVMYSITEVENEMHWIINLRSIDCNHGTT